MTTPRPTADYVVSANRRVPASAECCQVAQDRLDRHAEANATVAATFRRAFIRGTLDQQAAPECANTRGPVPTPIRAVTTNGS